MFVFPYVLRYRFFRMQRARAYEKTLRHTHIHVHLDPYFGNNAYQSVYHFFHFRSYFSKDAMSNGREKQW